MSIKKEEYERYKIIVKYNEGDTVKIKQGPDKGKTAKVLEVFSSMFEGPKYNLEFVNDPDLNGWTKEDLLEEEES